MLFFILLFVFFIRFVFGLHVLHIVFVFIVIYTACLGLHTTAATVVALRLLVKVLKDVDEFDIALVEGFLLLRFDVVLGVGAFTSTSNTVIAVHDSTTALVL